MAIIVLGCSAGLVGAAWAELPKAPRGRVSDFAGVMRSGDVERTEAVLTELQTKTGAEVALVTVDRVPDGDIERAAVELFKQWGIGQRGKDDGVLLLCAVQDRRVRIEVGYGLEAVLPDARCGRILDEEVLPRFRAGDLSGGLAAGALTVARTIAQAHGATLSDAAAAPVVNEGVPWSDEDTLALLLILFFVVLALATSRRRRGRDGRYSAWGSSAGWGWSAGGFGGGGGGFGGFGGGFSGGGGASRGW